MKCNLMHKRIRVAEIELDNATGFIKKIGKIYASGHLPVGVSIKKGVVDRVALNDWWTERSIPASRSGIRDALETLNIANTKILLIKCYGLSLSDQYWICPQDTDIIWDKINFFDNPFSNDIGDVLFGVNKKNNAFDLSSPDNTSDGNLKKRWKVINGKRCLVKGGSNPFRQQPFNEVIAAGIMERIGIPHIPYTIMWNQGVPYSVCEDFVTADTELIPAWRIMLTQKKENNVSVYRHFVSCCESMGIKDVVPFLDKMIALDYIIANEDRHFNNFGVLRNAETLEWLGMAPVYDSGSSFGYDKMPVQIYAERDIICKPFRKSHTEQLKLVSSFKWIDFEKLSDVRELIFETFAMEGASEYADEARVKAICDITQNRIRNLFDMSMYHTLAENMSTEGDVEENIAEEY